MRDLRDPEKLGTLIRENVAAQTDVRASVVADGLDKAFKRGIIDIEDYDAGESPLERYGDPSEVLDRYAEIKVV